MKEYSEYIDRLRLLVRNAHAGPHTEDLASRINAALDGQASQELRRLIPLVRRREAGAFFTGSTLAKQALKGFTETLTEQSVILDPACGAGDLLLPCIAQLAETVRAGPISETWQRQIAGRDLHTEFVDAAKLRLLLKVLTTSHGEGVHKELENPFSNIMVGDGTNDPDAVSAATHVVMNPPFGRVKTRDDCTWARGKASEAAVFMDTMCRQAEPGTRILAILPDSLRSGSNYSKWRQQIIRHSEVESVELFGQFDKSADIDVFALHLRIRSQPEESPNFNWTQVPDTSRYYVVGDRFTVSTGPVVDYRDPHEGGFHPFITGRELPAWKTVRHIEKKRKFAGRLIDPPFVAVRRTSRHGDAHRAVATVIDCGRPVAVENHVLVLSPNDHSLTSCRELMASLAHSDTTEWLNQRIRCRHLTVTVLAELPLWNTSK